MNIPTTRFLVYDVNTEEQIAIFATEEFAIEFIEWEVIEGRNLSYHPVISSGFTAVDRLTN